MFIRHWTISYLDGRPPENATERSEDTRHGLPDRRMYGGRITDRHVILTGSRIRALDSPATRRAQPVTPRQIVGTLVCSWHDRVCHQPEKCAPGGVWKTCVDEAAQPVTGV